jgi:hypothetical protein
VSHANAALTPLVRLRKAKLIVNEHRTCLWPPDVRGVSAHCRQTGNIATVLRARRTVARTVAPRSKRRRPLAEPAFVHNVFDGGPRYSRQDDTALLSQANGKIERFHRTLADGRAYARHSQSEAERRNLLPDRPHSCNNHRAHFATGGQSPITWLTNLPGITARAVKFHSPTKSGERFSRNARIPSVWSAVSKRS